MRQGIFASSFFQKVRIAIALTLAVFFTVLMLRLTIPYTSLKIDVDFLATKQSIIHLEYWRYAFYTHVFASVFVLLLGVVQFIPALAYKYKKVHRTIGLAYVVIVVLLSGPSGFIMGIYANGGFYAKISFVILSMLWIGFTATAYMKALRGKIEEHKAYMVRSYALTLSAITLRTYAYIIPSLVHMHGKDEYILIAWLSWVPNLIVAELLIWRKWTNL